MTAEEQRVDAAMHSQHRSDADRDKALTLYRLAQLRFVERQVLLERVADVLLGERAL